MHIKALLNSRIFKLNINNFSGHAHEDSIIQATDEN